MAMWTHFSQNEGNGNAEIEVTAEPNTQFKYRTGNIAAFGAEHGFTTIPVMQSPGFYYGMFAQYTPTPTALPLSLSSYIADQFNINTDLVPELIKWNSYNQTFKCIVIALKGFPVEMRHVPTGIQSVVTYEDPIDFTYNDKDYTVYSAIVNVKNSVDTIKVYGKVSKEPLVNFVFYRS